MAATYSISALANATGLTAHTIRAWEKRYGVTSPGRTGTNRRVYSESDVRRFQLLKSAVGNGHSISMVAALSDQDLAKLADHHLVAPQFRRDLSHLERCVASMMALDSDELESNLNKASMLLGVDRFLSDVVLPLVAELSIGWEEQRISIAQEHLASALLRTQLDRVRLSIDVPANAPRILVTTPALQLHEIGAMLAAITAALQGWNVTYLGPNLPYHEIAEAAAKTDSKAIGLSIVYPEDDPNLPGELRSLRKAVGPNFPIVIGGRAASHYQKAIVDIDAKTVQNAAELKDWLFTNQIAL